jgi:hypothetical protein
LGSDPAAIVDWDGREPLRLGRYEVGLWCAIRDALRDGRLFRLASRKYLDPAGFLLPNREWARSREELAITFDRPLDPAERLAALEAEQTRLIEEVQDAVDHGAGVRLDDRDRLVSSPPRADAEDPTIAEFVASVTGQIPDVELAAVRAGLQRLLGEEREAQIAEAYRRGYATEPQEDWIGEAGLRLGTEQLVEQVRAGDEPAA